MASTEIEIFRGDHHNVELQVVDKNGIPVNITGARLRMTIASRPVSMQKDSNNGIGEVEFTIPASGEAIIKYVPVDTATKEIGSYKFDVEMQLGGKTSTLLVGFFKLKEDVTI